MFYCVVVIHEYHFYRSPSTPLFLSILTNFTFIFLRTFHHPKQLLIESNPIQSIEICYSTSAYVFDIFLLFLRLIFFSTFLRFFFFWFIYSTMFSIPLLLLLLFLSMLSDQLESNGVKTS